MSDVKNWVSRYYCQYSGIMIGFGLVFAFLLGIRTASFWQQWLSNGPALAAGLGTACLFSLFAYMLLSHIQASLYKHLGEATTCSR